MATVTIHQAKTNLSKLIERAKAGEEIIIAKGKEPVARLEPFKRKTGKRGLAGIMKGKVAQSPRLVLLRSASRGGIEGVGRPRGGRE